METPTSSINIIVKSPEQAAQILAFAHELIGGKSKATAVKKKKTAPVVEDPDDDEAIDDDVDAADEDNFDDMDEEAADDEDDDADDETEDDEDDAPKKKVAAKSAPAKKATSAKITEKQMNDHAVKHSKKHKRANTLAVLKKHFKVQSITELKPAQYEAAIKVLKI